MRVLAIDTSSKVLGVAVMDEAAGAAEFNFDLGLRHASHLVPTIKRALAFAGAGLGDIDAYCVSIGPGSFTGLRIGVSAVKALWLADKKKVVAVPALDVLARNIAHTDSVICVTVDAKKEKFYTCFYEYVGAPFMAPVCNGFDKSNPYKKITSTLLVSYCDLLERLSAIKNGIILVGDGVEKIRNSKFEIRNLKKKIIFTSREFWYPRAINVARIGLDMLKRGRVVKDVDALTPLYLHPRDAQCRK